MDNISKIRVNEIDYNIIDRTAIHDPATEEKLGGIKSGKDITVDENGLVNVLKSDASYKLIDSDTEDKGINSGSSINPVYFADGKPIPSGVIASDSKPIVARGDGEPGVSEKYSRADHVHPTQQSTPHADIADKLGTETIGDTQTPIYLDNGVATECVEIPKPSNKTPIVAGRAESGTSYSYAREDHIHPEQTYTQTAGVADQLGTDNVGSENTPIYLSLGIPKPFTKTIGTNSKPVFLSSGVLTACTNNIPEPSDNPALAPGIGKSGVSYKYSREDHVHPVQTFVDNANISNKLGTTTIGNQSRPIYLHEGTPTVCIDIPTANESMPSDLLDTPNPGSASNILNYARIDHVHKIPTRLNSSINVGTVTEPIYIKNGVPTKCSLDLTSINPNTLFLPDNYKTSDQSNEDLLLKPGDSLTNAFSKLEKAIIDDELLYSTSIEILVNSIGLNDQLKYVPPSGSTYISNTVSVLDALKRLDYAISQNAASTYSINTNNISTNISTLSETQNNNSGGYTENFEWLDGNTKLEDRSGYFVTLNGGKLIKANSNNKFVLGVVTSSIDKSASVSVIGTNIVLQDGTLEQDNFCSINNDGKATIDNNGKYYVIEIIDNSNAKILFK